MTLSDPFPIAPPFGRGFFVLKSKRMREFTIFKRLGLGYFVILLLVIALGVYFTLKLGQLKQITRSISSIDSETIRMANRLRDAFFSQGGVEKKYFVAKVLLQ